MNASTSFQGSECSQAPPHSRRCRSASCLPSSGRLHNRYRCRGAIEALKHNKALPEPLSTHETVRLGDSQAWGSSSVSSNRTAHLGAAQPKVVDKRTTSLSTPYRRLVLQSTCLPILAALIGGDEPSTLVNSLLSAYGLPTMKAAQGFRLFDEFENDYTFEYPRSWVGRPNSMRKGVYLSNFQAS